MSTKSRPPLHSLEEYTPPEWALSLKKIPQHRYCLGLTPTPVHRWYPPGIPSNVEMWIKREDLSGMQLSGNKARKLEFLLAEAKSKGHDCVITIGDIQSNHCRATAVAARYLGLDSHLILSNSDRKVDHDPGLEGNLLVERMVGAHIHQVTKTDIARAGYTKPGEILADQLRNEGKNPYVIPTGGSNALGTWGYLDCVKELKSQVEKEGITDIVMACGSGSTTGGLALGVFLSGWDVRLHAYGICDSVEYFYNCINDMYLELGVDLSSSGKSIRDVFELTDAQGAGYAISREEELRAVKDISLATGVILDPVYTGKVMFNFFKDVNSNPELWQGRKVLFLHSGGLLGMYEQVTELQPIVEGLGKCSKLSVP